MTTPVKLGLIGQHISYSMSPRVFQAIYHQVDFSGEFDLLSVSPEELAVTLVRLKKEGYAGVAVTIPHKQSVMALLDSLDEPAMSVGAVNWIRFSAEGMMGFNTDAIGFATSLSMAGVAGNMKDVLIVGSGGSARAVIHTLASDFKLQRAMVVSRRPDAAKESLEHFGSTLGVTVKSETASAALRDRTYDLIVNCSPLGGWHYPDLLPLGGEAGLRSTSLYYDLNYNLPNMAVAMAREQGVRACDGSMMLVAQATEAFRILTGERVDTRSVCDEVFGAERIERGW